LNARQALAEQGMGGAALVFGAIAVAAPVDIAFAEVVAVRPQALVDHGLKARPIGAGAGAEDARPGLLPGPGGVEAVPAKLRLLGAEAGGGGIVGVAFRKLHDGAGGAVQKIDLVGKGVAEKARN